MIKDSPNPPDTEAELEKETDPVSPYAFLDSKKLHDAAIRALDHYLAPPPEKKAKADRRPSSVFVIAPNVDSETLLAHACETLVSANVMASELAFGLNGPTCNLMLAVQQMISLAELSVNRVLDQVDPHQ
ncbi:MULTISPECIES: DUF6124 family protein [unclassified Pseudomonas]|uniref:DUF6124 family protein n=1 Tax=unclassified Pseudomonas TaxID=196821 RepID=UPI00119D9F95|nr:MULTISPECIES: DUF6124 family protein [unclassified Pseudomonas]TWC25050.1 hypothetical protein FBY05_10310 [Pseudomonas sp. SJZ083]TWC51307.1 hypothetical protein FBY01_10310 [Pseudomonas sp. SJZ077]